MLLSIILRGFIVGLLASMPPGPVGVLCIQRTLSKNQRSGMASGLGAATADVVYALIAFFSLAFILEFIARNSLIITSVGGLIVVGLGVKVLFSNPVIQIRRNRAGKTNLWHDFLTVFLVTIANPVYIFFFIILFAVFGLNTGSVGLWQSSFMIIGVFLGGAAWWFLLSFLVNLFRKKFRPRHMLWINRISAVIIILFGLAAIFSEFLNFRIDGLL
ncbi:MAG: LysE family translocator [Rikenellaceae bacterium]|nr:LysE family translocator [Rikenellaceae bacterium]MCL2692938.1 LysE family translocator [Rikenellaceae bacterium]